MGVGAHSPTVDSASATSHGDPPRADRRSELDVNLFRGGVGRFSSLDVLASHEGPLKHREGLQTMRVAVMRRRAGSRVCAGSASASRGASCLRTVSYLIHRMCDAAGAYSGRELRADPEDRGEAGNSQAIFGNQFTSTPIVYYRVTVRVQGPRNTMSIVQSNIGIQH